MNLFYKYIFTIIEETNTIKGLIVINHLVERLLSKNQLTFLECQQLQYKLEVKLIELEKKRIKDKTNN